ncbi:hypothetical protein E2C01_097659 [Portunus trituberculatus]|uniref:Uncharacterized protein n=1 Tax=Portunus trituberculatus TaxID=210409 RepID=A0A5B7JZ75_PORTR|nr:hypothetical protein [Portunus trituberculatus]
MYLTSAASWLRVPLPHTALWPFPRVSQGSPRLRRLGLARGTEEWLGGQGGQEGRQEGRQATRQDLVNRCLVLVGTFDYSVTLHGTFSSFQRLLLRLCGFFKGVFFFFLFFFFFLYICGNRV